LQKSDICVYVEPSAAASAAALATVGTASAAVGTTIAAVAAAATAAVYVAAIVLLSTMECQSWDQLPLLLPHGSASNAVT
jgi:hypothetical protein